MLLDCPIMFFPVGKGQFQITSRHMPGSLAQLKELIGFLNWIKQESSNSEDGYECFLDFLRKREVREIQERELEFRRQKSIPSNETRETFVYLMRDGATGYFKIGNSRNPSSRERTLLAQIPRIELIWKMKATCALERKLHDQFSSKRIRGEWFDLSEEDVRSITSLDEHLLKR